MHKLSLSDDFQIPIIDACLHGDRRSPVHQARLFLQEGGRVNFASRAIHGGAARPGVREREGRE